jgi:hypothetical protein
MWYDEQPFAESRKIVVDIRHYTNANDFLQFNPDPIDATTCCAIIDSAIQVKVVRDLSDRFFHVTSTSADDWPQAPLNGVLIVSIVFLTLLPALGWAWHRVLPEHTHVFLQAVHSDEDEIVPAAPMPEGPDPCLVCTTPQMSSGIEHLPSTLGLQVLGIVASLGVMLLSFVPPAFQERVILSAFSYQSPIFFPPDPPPNAAS